MNFVRGFVAALALCAPVWAAPSLVDLAGKPAAIDRYLGQGRWTVVAVWSVDCAICRRELHHMAFMHDEHRDGDIAVVGLSVDGASQRQRVAEFVEEQALSFPHLIGVRADVALLGAAPLKGTPTYLFFSPKGKLVAQRVGALTQDDAERVIADARAEQR